MKTIVAASVHNYYIVGDACVWLLFVTLSESVSCQEDVLIGQSLFVWHTFSVVKSSNFPIIKYVISYSSMSFFHVPSTCMIYW